MKDPEWDLVLKRLHWADDKWDEIQAYLLRRLAEEYGESLGHSAFLHFIEVQDGPETLYGVSLEPELVQAPLKEFSESLFYYVVADPAKTRIAGVRATELSTPFTFDRVPEVLSKDAGFFLLRDSTRDERAEWSARNTVLLGRMGVDSVDPSEVGWVKQDLKYNIMRGEFGIGDAKKKTNWRKSLRGLDSVGPALAKELEDLMFSMRIPKTRTFEKRTKEWIQNNEDAMVFITGE